VTSQADSAGSIPVTRSTLKAQVGEFSERWVFGCRGLDRLSCHQRDIRCLLADCQLIRLTPVVLIAKSRRTLAVRRQTSRRVRDLVVRESVEWWRSSRRARWCRSPRQSGWLVRAGRPCRTGARGRTHRRSPVRQPGRTGRAACGRRVLPGRTSVQQGSWRQEDPAARYRPGQSRPRHQRLSVALTRRQGEEQPGHLLLEADRSGSPLPTAITSGLVRDQRCPRRPDASRS
jgi:hypothetical protein